ncbi:MAG: CAP domain-containing protein [Chloroflexi bacterium]|nr:CAP domain-containing protein [Chloroflexota bacterium]MBU1750044.1 CAP domain-containing protein [Chloroflexota bacterium]
MYRLRALSMLLIVLVLCLSGSQPGQMHGADTLSQSADLVYHEACTVYLGNLARRDNGVPPLRWNAQMTDAARWFSWDSVENQPDGYCGHQDTLGRWPSTRVPAFGYRGYCGAENCFCGYVTPEDAIQGWLNSAGHRANLLDPNSREVGLGTYRRASDGRGYVTQDFGQDPVFPPVIIAYEALTTTNSTVNLYIYDRSGGGGFAGLGPATEMKVSNDPCLTGAAWEPYAAHRTWTLAPGTGWRTVYVQTRDAVGRTTVVSDTIYLGANVPLAELGLAQAASTTDRVTVYDLAGGGRPYVQFSQNWFADDTFDTFHLWWGNGERVNDATAQGGTAFRLCPGDGESFAWVYTTEFFHDTPLVAYFRLKVNDNTAAAEVARISVTGGGTEYGPLSLKGTDFAAPNVYQEFPIPFTFPTNPDDVFLLLNFWRSGSADVYVDGMSIFTAPQAIASPLTWLVPGGNYRGGGIWLRYTDGAGDFSAVTDAVLNLPRLSVSPAALGWTVDIGRGEPPAMQTLTVGQSCGPFVWDVTAPAPWLQVQPVGDTIQVSVDLTGLVTGTYQTTITITAAAGALGSPVVVPVTLTVVHYAHRLYLPLVLRG